MSKNSSKKSKLLGIARWLKRQIMWYSGHGDLLLTSSDSDDSSYENSDEDDDISSRSGLHKNFESASDESTSSNNEFKEIGSSVYQCFLQYTCL